MANSQNYGHVLDLDKPFVPTLEQEEEFQADLKYIYQAFSVAWSNGLNYKIESDHKYTQDGRAVYMDALKYFKGRAFTQVELQDAITGIVNNKLSPSTHDGAEGYNSKFNEYIDTIEGVGIKLPDELVRCLYLANIQDDQYETIKDQTTLDNLSTMEVQALMLKKYLDNVGIKQRSYRQHIVQTEQDVLEPTISSTQLKTTNYTW